MSQPFLLTRWFLSSSYRCLHSCGPMKTSSLSMKINPLDPTEGPTCVPLEKHIAVTTGYIAFAKKLGSRWGESQTWFPNNGEKERGYRPESLASWPAGSLSRHENKDHGFLLVYAASVRGEVISPKTETLLCRVFSKVSLQITSLEFITHSTSTQTRWWLLHRPALAWRNRGTVALEW